MAEGIQKPSRIVVLISGNGSNLQALIGACNTPRLPDSNIVRVISNRKDAYGLIRAQKAAIPTTYHNLLSYKRKQAATEEGVRLARLSYDQDLATMILENDPNLVVCAGWMHILSPDFVTALESAGVAVINLHPALPGQFSGASAIRRAHKAFHDGYIDHTGVMIHRVISEVDMGEPIVTRKVPMMKGETEEELEGRIHQVEWDLIIEGTAKAIQEIRARDATSG